jgi:glycosyltransferase involved in cell wall biosynthesis
MTHILHITEDHSPANTGITSAVDALMRQVQPALSLSVLSTGSQAIPLPAGVDGILLPTRGIGSAWRFAPHARQRLAQQVQQADVIHLHGAWMWVQWAAARQAARQRKPFVLSLHGMLEPWIWQRQHLLHQLKKKLYWQLLAFPAFRYASLVHAIHAREAETLKAYFPHLPIQVISPSLDLDAVEQILAGLPPVPDPAPYVLFLGRLHPVKGIDLLIEAFAHLNAPHLRLKIAGPLQEREAAYAARLKRMVQEAGLEDRVDFLGAVTGQAKWALLHRALVFCLPSHSEVVGMVNLEAAACRTPVITTLATGLPSAWAEAGGILVEPSVPDLVSALSQAACWTPPERAARGEGLHRLVKTSYSWEAASTQWIELYQRLAGAP